MPPLLSYISEMADQNYYELYETAANSDAVVEVVENMKLHRSRGWYETDRAIKSVERFVVEPAAIELAAGRRWFKLYPADMRRSVARSIVSSWERELDGT